MHLSPRGTALGTATFLTGLALDKEQSSLPPCHLYMDGVALAAVNLLLLGPLLHSCAIKCTRPSRVLKTVFDVSGIILVHSGLYELVHRCLHKVKCLRPIHRDHHRFKNEVMPTAANAVSAQEFLIAYMMPFFVATFVLRPSKISLDAAVTVVSAANLFVHTPSFDHITMPHWLVHPKDHLTHHKKRTGNYAAPTIAWYAI